jgi:hypothetical protein
VRKILLLLAVFLCVFMTAVTAQRVAILRDVKAVHVEPTVVRDPDKVKEDFAPNLVQDALRNALRNANFEISDAAPIKAHIVLEEFSSGSTAKRFLIGMGAGRSSVAGRLVFQDAAGKELVNVRMKVRGSLVFSSYQGGNTQRRQAVASFDQRLMEEIARLK